MTRAAQTAITQLRAIAALGQPVTLSVEEVLELADLLEFENNRSIGHQPYVIFGIWSFLISAASVGIWRWLTA